ncbi:PE family protein PE27A [Mycobacterium tuberculosis TB_RSA12]|nr:PE family protein PE27A [Mycobacterium tuberculosis TB_RSA12]
MTARLAAAH